MAIGQTICSPAHKGVCPFGARKQIDMACGSTTCRSLCALISTVNLYRSARGRPRANGDLSRDLCCAVHLHYAIELQYWQQLHDHYLVLTTKNAH